MVDAKVMTVPAPDIAHAVYVPPTSPVLSGPTNVDPESELMYARLVLDFAASTIAPAPFVQTMLTSGEPDTESHVLAKSVLLEIAVLAP